MKILKILGLASTIFLTASPVTAGYKLIAANKSTTVQRAGISVVPTEDWNRLGARVGRNAESWTLDGLTLNDVTFYGGIGNGQTLFREVNKKEKPLPQFSDTMLAPDVAQLFEASYRIANSTSLFSIDAVEPATFAGHPGFHFTYSFSVQDEDVKRSGEATGAIVGGKLYMITYEAPALHYFARNLMSYRAIVSGARIAPVAKRR